MENLNAEQIRYKMSEKHIIRALECLCKPNSSPDDREKCFFMWKEPSCFSCHHEVAQNALALITSQEQRIGAQDMTISELRQRAEKAEHDADRYAQRIKELSEENERVKLEYAGFEAGAKHAVSFVKADTVREMQKALEHRIHSKLSYHGWYLKETVIAEIAKEMLEENK